MLFEEKQSWKFFAFFFYFCEAKNKKCKNFFGTLKFRVGTQFHCVKHVYDPKIRPIFAQAHHACAKMV